MRSKSLSGVIWGVVVTVLTLLPSSYGQTYTNLFTWDTYWSYNQNGTNLPANWKDIGYDDSAWPVGAGLLGWPQNETLPGLTPPFIWTPLNITNIDSGKFVTNFYFRTTFVFTNNPTNVVLVASNLIDDGAVFYLNGALLGTIAMPATFNQNTFATRQDEISAHGLEVRHYGPTNLIQGTNVLAVELHQGNNNSSDAIFGMDLSWYRGTRANITLQPVATNIIACAGKPAFFGVNATGSDINFMWYSNNVYLSNQIGSIMTLDVANTTANNAIFHVIVSNALNNVRSSNGVLRVFPDQCGPRVLLAESRDFAGATNQIEVKFDEHIRLTNITHYKIADLSNAAPITVTAALFATPPATVSNIVRLTVNQPLIRSNHAYVLTINEVRDRLNNVIAPNTTIPVTFKTLTNVFPFNTEWTFDDSWQTDPPYVQPNTWTNLNFNDAAWGTGVGTFYRDNFRATPCGPDGETMSNFADIPTIYFRKRFPYLGPIPDRVELILTNQIDDGAVWYLNGNEIWRTRMAPTGNIFHNTPPTPNVEAEFPGCSVTNIDVSGSMINRGNNILAVELHNTTQDPSGDNDAVFGVSLTFGLQSGVPLHRSPAKALSITRAGSNLTIGWPTNGLGTNNGFILQFANHINTNLWREVQTNMANPFVTPMTNAARFYRICLED